METGKYRQCIGGVICARKTAGFQGNGPDSRAKLDSKAKVW